MVKTYSFYLGAMQLRPQWQTDIYGKVHSLPRAYSDIALVVDLEQVVLGLSEGSLSQRFALDLNISEPSTQYICLSAELQAGSAAA